MFLSLSSSLRKSHLLLSEYESYNQATSSGSEELFQDLVSLLLLCFLSYHKCKDSSRSQQRHPAYSLISVFLVLLILLILSFPVLWPSITSISCLWAIFHHPEFLWEEECQHGRSLVIKQIRWSCSKCYSLSFGSLSFLSKILPDLSLIFILSPFWFLSSWS